MSNLAEHITLDATSGAPAAELAAWSSMLRAAILTIPESHRPAVFNRLRDVLPPSLLKSPPAPQRGGELLNNVFQLFQSDPMAERAVADVVAALAAEMGKKVEAQPVRLALNYLNSRRILRRVGYGKYQLENGEIVDGPA
jgi:hypothetical protein